MERSVLRGILLLIAGILFVIAGMWYLHKQGAPKREAYGTLATCLQDSDTTYYGAFWCPQCAKQAALFGDAARKLPYVECSTPDRSDQTEVCKEAQVTNYPTWQFVSGMRCTGVVDERVLAHLASCDAPNFDGTVWTPQSLYEDIVVRSVRERLTQQQVDEAGIEELLQTFADRINTELTDTYGTTIETEESSEQMLESIAIAFSQCAIFEPEVVEVSDVELNPES